MKNFLTLILSMFTAISSLGQSKSDNYILTLDFWPSFMGASELSIRAKGDSAGFLNILIYKGYKMKELSIECNATIPAHKLIALTNFLKTYKFRVKNSIDTIGSHKEFVKGDSVLVYDIQIGHDGITVEGLFSQDNATKKFAFWSPDKGTENARLMVLLFDLIDNASNDQKVEDYIEQLQQYFPHQLGLKKLSDNPLTYKLFGSISYSEADEFYDFLQKLPLHEKVVIDMSNYSGMGTMFYDAFDEYHVIRRNVYWLNPTFRGLVDLYKSGIPRRQLISKKRLVVIKKNGREVFSLKDD